MFNFPITIFYDIMKAFDYFNHGLIDLIILAQTSKFKKAL